MKTDTENYDSVLAFIIFYHNRSGAVNKGENIFKAGGGKRKREKKLQKRKASGGKTLTKAVLRTIMFWLCGKGKRAKNWT